MMNVLSTGNDITNSGCHFLQVLFRNACNLLIKPGVGLNKITGIALSLINKKLNNEIRTRHFL